jgi:hypothetical protein
MNNAYDFQSWSKLHREEALREARKRHLVGRARTAREPRESSWLEQPWRNPLALRRGA